MHPSEKKIPYRALQAWALLIILSLLWGTSFILIKKALGYFSPLQISSLRVSITGACFLGLGIYYHRYWRRAPWWSWTGAGVWGVVAPGFLFPVSQLGVSSSVVAVLNGLSPIFTAIFGVMMLHKTISRDKQLGLLLGFAGAGLLVMLNNDGVMTFNGFALFAIAATVANGLYGNWVQRYIPADVPSLPTTALSLAAVLPIGLVGMWLTGVVPHLAAHPQAWQGLGYVIFLGVVSTSLAMLGYNYLLQLASPLFSSTVAYLIPVVALTWGWLDGEVISLPQIIAMTAIVGGVYLLNRGKR